MGSKTSTEAKRKYNQKAYVTHLYSYRKESDLSDKIQEFKAKKGTSLNSLITELLADHFDVNIPTPDNYTRYSQELKVEEQKIEDELHQEANAIRENLAKLRKAADIPDQDIHKAPQPTGDNSDEYLIRSKGFAPLPTRKLIEIWVEMREKGCSDTDLAEYTKELSGHKFAARNIATQIDGFLEQLKAGIAEPRKCF